MKKIIFALAIALTASCASPPSPKHTPTPIVKVPTTGVAQAQDEKMGAGKMLTKNITPEQKLWKAYKYAQGLIFEVKFEAARGQHFIINAPLTATVNPQASDQYLVVVSLLTCEPNRARPLMPTMPALTTSANIERGRTKTLASSRLYVANKKGLQTCRLFLRTGRPRAGLGLESSNTVTVEKPSTVEVYEAGENVNEYFSPFLPTQAVVTGQPTQAFASVNIFRKKSSRGEILLALYLTSCTAPSGSFDMVANRNVCTGRNSKKADAEVQAQIVITSKNCAPQIVWQQNIEVKVDVHHLALWQNFTFPLKAKCQGQKLTLNVTSVGETAMVVHQSGTLLRVKVT